MVSIIIPVYNTENYLRQCIDSVLAQTYTDYELVLVDDGSTDSSGAICDEYVGNYSGITVVHQQNAGLPAARKMGMAHAHGDYILFIDADDWVDANHVESLITVAEREQADVVMCGFVHEYPQKQVIFTNRPVSSDGKGVIIESLNNTLHAGVVFKLIRRTLFMDYDIKYPKYNFFEDMYLSTEILLNARKIISTGLTTYHYRYHQSSETYGGNMAFRFRKYKEFRLNMQELFDEKDLWGDEQMRKALKRRINKERLELLKFPLRHLWRSI